VSDLPPNGPFGSIAATKSLLSEYLQENLGFWSFHTPYMQPWPQQRQMGLSVPDKLTCWGLAQPLLGRWPGTVAEKLIL
jgi:hypothetical protein